MSAVPAYIDSGALPLTSGEPVILCDTEESRVILQQRTASALGCQLDEGFRLAPRGGVEMGGLLVGSCRDKGQVLIEDIVPVNIEYKFGPSFRLSEADGNALKLAVASAVNGGKGELIGVYRSQCRGASELRPSDDEFLDLIGAIHAPALVNLRTFLLLRRQSKSHFSSVAHTYAGSAWKSAAEVVIRHTALTAIIEVEDEAATAYVAPRVLPTVPQRTARTSESVPAAALLRTAPAPEAEPAVVYEDASFDTATEEEAVSVEVPEENAPASSAPLFAGVLGAEEELAPSSWSRRIEALRSRHPRQVYMAGVIAIVMSLGGGYGLFMAAKDRPATVITQGAPNQASLGFKAVRQSSGWKLSWRRAPIFALEPSGGILTIRDGGSEQHIALGLDELAIGSILYTPHSGDVAFVLEVTAAGKPAATERLRLLEPGFKPEP